MGVPAEIRPEKTRDRFVWRWTLGCAVALVLGSACPYDPAWYLLHMDLRLWPSPYLAVYYPILLAGLTLGSLGLKDRLRRGGMILIFTFAAVFTQFIHLLHYCTDGLSLTSLWEADVLVTRFQMIIGAALVASGNRVMRSFPHQAAPRIMLGTGGALVIASFLLSWESWSRPALYGIVFDWYADWRESRMGFGILLLAFGALGFLTAFARYRLKARYRMLSVGAYLVIAACMMALWVNRNSGWTSTFFSVPVMCLKLGLLVMAHVVLLALGLATWVEELMVREEASRSESRPA